MATSTADKAAEPAVPLPAPAPGQTGEQPPGQVPGATPDGQTPTAPNGQSAIQHAADTGAKADAGAKAGTAGAGQPPKLDAGTPVAGTAPATLWRTCPNCGAQVHAAEDWCPQCGAVAPDGLDAAKPFWRTGATLTAAVVLLVAGAAAATYAALKQSKHKTRTPTTVVARVAPSTPVAPPAASTQTTGKPATPGALGSPAGHGATGATGSTKPLLPLARIKPPKIPLIASTPTPLATRKGSATTPASGKATTPTKTTKKAASPRHSGTTGSPGSGEQAGEPILLDTDAASTYNPYSYPASSFGDPSLAIDDEASTAWTAQVNLAVAPKMAEGLAIDLNSRQHISTLALATSTPGMTVQVYGTASVTLPASITSPAWVQLSRSLVAKHRNTRIKLGNATTAYRFVLLWISRAPASAIGTPQAPGSVSVNEIELFPAR